jgi:8-oxo-dGTP pyrophosphatase MutT (NUDIX family)
VPHIHPLIDFTVCGVLVRGDRVLMVHHRALGRWLFPGGHIELDEDPDEALEREMREECGVPVQWLEHPPAWPAEIGVKFLRRPHRAEIHHIDSVHRHVTFVYYGRALADQPTLSAAEHHEIRWVTPEELDDEGLGLSESLKLYAREAVAATQPQFTA